MHQISMITGITQPTIEVYILDSVLVSKIINDYHLLYDKFNLKRLEYESVLISGTVIWLLGLDRILK